MNPDKVIREHVKTLTDLPNIGKAMEADLLSLGITEPGQLCGRSAQDLYQQLCRQSSAQHDPCVFDVFISIIRFMAGDVPKPWWHYTRERKEFFNQKHLLAVTDIFGRTTAFDNLIKKLSRKFTSVEIVDPYDGEARDFENEDDAYAGFQKQMGLTGYIRKVNDMLWGRQYLSQIIIGFSAGASAVWAVSPNMKAFKNTRAICFYSSQIRHLLDITPEIKTDIYFAARENTYDVDDVISRLSSNRSVNCIKTDFFHGFMNEKSRNFNKKGYARYIEILKDQFKS
ncbi:helix-hairpin-helix domain-containing protein [uncultured Desulfobacter sp.]|uniref:helix-hairpin-helix domain-containing protein n=1 Tax=uncultured Desulfobacter sp. TaxID=240139 RepID=UPI002AAAD2D2|nr:helix-hairpin-helix domain-containing protein [uncultured Desulfobacter sp.]